MYGAPTLDPYMHAAYLQIPKSKPYHLTTIIILFILQMNKLRSRDMKSLAEVYSFRFA